MRYRYLASTDSGNVVAGTIEACEGVDAERALGHAGYRIHMLKALKASPSLQGLFPTLFGIKSGEVIGLSRQLATLLESGVDLVTAMEILKEQASSGPVAKMLSEIADSLRSGESLTSAMSRYPAAFSTTYRRIVEVGEQVGAPEEALKHAATCMEKQKQSAQKIMQAMLYPSIVTGMAILVGIILVVVVLPPMVRMFTNLQVQLPLPTRILIAVTSFVNGHILELLLAFVAGIVLLLALVRRPQGRRQLDRLLLRLPLLGKILLYSELARFARTMSTLLQAGVTMSESISLATGSCTNRVITEALDATASELLQGAGMAGPMTRTKLFPPMLVQMVRVGEETGRLESNLSVVAESYEATAGERTQAMISTVEPALTLAIAVVVGFIALSVILPMYSLMGSIS